MRITSVKILIAITVIVFLFTLLDTTAVYDIEGSHACCPRDFYEDYCDPDLCEYKTCCDYTFVDYNFASIPDATLERPWTLITSMFLHVGFFHIIMNMLGLVLFGIYLEKVVGWKNFLLIYFVGGILGSIAYVAFAIYLGEGYIPSIGASGGVYAIITALMVVRPYDEILKPREKGFLHDVFWVGMFGYSGFLQLFFVGMLFLAVAASGVLVDFMAGAQGGVANSAHLGGGVAGIILGFYFRGHYKDQDAERRSTHSEQTQDYFEDRVRAYEESERRRELEERHQRAAREEGARAVRRNEFGEYEYVDKEDEDELEIEDEKQREPQDRRQDRTQRRRRSPPADEDSDDELEIID